MQSAQAPSNYYDYDDYDDEYDDYYSTTTVPKTTTTQAPTTTTEAPTTTVAPTTTTAPKTVPTEVLNKHVDPPAATPVAESVDELASTGAGSAVLAGIGAAAIALGLLARRTARSNG